MSSKEHEILFRNISIIKTVIETIYKEEHRDSLEVIIQSYKKNIKNFIEVYEKYFSVLQTADCIIVDKTHHPEFLKFVANPAIPNGQPLFHNFIHRPMEHFLELQKHFQIILSQSKIDSQEYRDLNRLIEQLKVSLLFTTWNNVNFINRLHSRL